MSAPVVTHDRAWRGYRDGEPVVSTCRKCAGWSSLASSQAEARKSASDHLERVHGYQPTDARKSARVAARRAGSDVLDVQSLADFLGEFPE